MAKANLKVVSDETLPADENFRLAHLPISELRASEDNRKVGDVSDLVASIKEIGVIQPITVTPIEAGYQIVFGHRRVEAAKNAGAEAWFWIEGYSGSPIEHFTDAFGQPIEIQATVNRYEWSFGDGTGLVSHSAGDPYPERSEVRHTYQRSSEGTDGHLVVAKFVFAVRFRVAGGVWTELSGISRTTSFRYQVRQSQAVISR